MRKSLWLIIVAAAFLVGGIQGLYTYIYSPKPITMTCEEFLQTKPKTKWIELSNCELALSQAMYAGYFGSINKLYVPTRPIGASETSNTSIIVLTDNEKDIQIVNKMNDLEQNNHDFGLLVEWLAKHANEILVKRNISGLIQAEIDQSSSNRETIKSMAAEIDNDFVIIEEGKKPELLFPILMILAGFAFLAGFVVILIKRKKEKMKV